ncbi:MAG: hypothetical protein AAFV86_08375 [Pseudomonadota bacterium]
MAGGGSGGGVAEDRDGAQSTADPGTAVLESRDVDHWIVDEGGEAHFFVLDIVPVDG